MEFLETVIENGAATVQLKRGRSNALNQEMVSEIREHFQELNKDASVKGVVITGQERFYSVGLDLIELFEYNENQVLDFWRNFNSMVYDLAAFSKPMVASITGHSPAGGCVIALCCDYRVLAQGKYQIGLNEIPVGIVLPKNIFHLYSFWLGKAKAYEYLMEGKLVLPETALEVNMVNEVVLPEEVLAVSQKKLNQYLRFEETTWVKSKANLRKELLENMTLDLEVDLQPLIEQWWAPGTRKVLAKIIASLKK